MACRGFVAGVLRPAIREGETFAFSMSNPPFFEAIEEAGRNPKTAFSGVLLHEQGPGLQQTLCSAQDAQQAVQLQAVMVF